MIVLYTTERDYPWGTLRSTHASKTKVVLEEKRLRYRIENLRPGDLWKKPPAMLARHPLGKVPYIEDEGVTIFDSTVIDEYLDDRYGPPRLLPDDPLARAQVREFEQFADEALLGGDLPLIWMAYWSEPDKRDAERMEKGREGLRRRDLPFIERTLGAAPSGGYLRGGFTMADVPMMVMAMVLEVDQLALDEFPRVQRYLRELRQRDAAAANPDRRRAAARLGIRAQRSSLASATLVRGLIAR